MYDYTSLIRSCHDREEEEAAQGIDVGAMMLGSLSSRLERDFFPKFQELGWQYSRRFRSIATTEEFDGYHHGFVTAFRETIKTRSGMVASYGEAQQPVNIFLKDYLENTSLVAAADHARLNRFLHVTLDGVMIYYLQSFFREDYLRHIGPESDACGYFDSGKVTSFHHQDTSPSQLKELLFIGRNTYRAWQNWFRQIYPSRPALLDAIWSIARQTLFAGGIYWSAPQQHEERSLTGRILKLLNIGRDDAF